MNKDRRNSLNNILFRIIALQDELRVIKNQEMEYRDSIPDHLVNSKRYSNSDEAIDLISGAIEELNPVIDYIRYSIR